MGSEQGEAGQRIWSLKERLALLNGELHHTANDTLDKFDPAQLSQNVAAWAGLLWLIADSDVDFRAMRPATTTATPAAH